MEKIDKRQWMQEISQLYSNIIYSRVSAMEKQ